MHLSVQESESILNITLVVSNNPIFSIQGLFRKWVKIFSSQCNFSLTSLFKCYQNNVSFYPGIFMSLQLQGRSLSDVFAKLIRSKQKFFSGCSFNEARRFVNFGRLHTSLGSCKKFHQDKILLSAARLYPSRASRKSSQQSVRREQDQKVFSRGF